MSSPFPNRRVALFGSLLVATIMVPVAARAEFSITLPPPPPKPVVAPVRQLDDGGGFRVPLLLAATAIVPLPNLVEIDVNVDTDAKVSWEGDHRPWQQVLTGVLNPLGYAFRQNGQHVVIYAMSTVKKPVPLLPIAIPHSSAITAVALTSPATVAPDAPQSAIMHAAPASITQPEPLLPAPAMPVVIVPPPPLPVWNASPGETLYDFLNQVAKTSGWNFVDNTGRDYPIRLPFTIDIDENPAEAAQLRELQKHLPASMSRLHAAGILAARIGITAFPNANPPLHLDPFLANNALILNATGDNYGASTP